MNAIENKIIDFVKTIVKDNIEDTIVLSKDKISTDENILSSKLGGLKYWSPNGKKVTSNGKILYPLIQINFSDIKNGLDGYPTSGLLQIFIEDDDLAGSENGNWKIRFFSEDMLSQKNVKESDIVSLNEPTYLDEIFENPENSWSLKASMIKTLPQNISQIIDDKIIGEFGNDVFENMSTKLIDEINEITTDSGATFEDKEIHIGGHTFFTQEDPRNKDKSYTFNDGYTRILNRVLVQIDSDYDTIHWGDSGICNVLINSEDLKHLDFDHVLYTWDCY